MKPDFPSLADEVAEPHPDMNIKVVAFTVSENSSNTETTYKIEILPLASLHMIFSKKQMTKALIRLWGCAGWFVAVLFKRKPLKTGFLLWGPFYVL